MKRAVRGGGAVALAPGLAFASALALAPAAGAACVAIDAHPDGTPLAQFVADRFDISYVHSVTRTPVLERYRVDGSGIQQTELRFVEHGPGLPTEADAGQRFLRYDDGFVVTLERRFDTIVMRVQSAQSPRLAADGASIDLAHWGDRAISVRAGSRCP